MFILALIFIVIGVIALIVAASNARARVVASGETPNGSAFRRGTNVVISRTARWVAVAVFVLAAVFLAFFVFNKQAFLNYYWLVGSLIVLAIVPAIADEVARRGDVASIR